MKKSLLKRMKHRFEKIITKLLFNLPYVRDYITTYPPGHFYSPIPSREDILKREKAIYDGIEKKPLLDIDLNENNQFKLLEDLKIYYDDAPLMRKKNKKSNLRYYLENNMFDYTDAYFLHSIIRHFKPKKYIEIGSGFSSAVALDTNDNFLYKKMECRFIEPYPDRLYSLLTEEDKQNNKLRIDVNIVQNSNIDVLKELEKDDILLIDSSHVAKLGSDVNYIIFEIFPRLKNGVIIHIHDIQYPFEYYREFFIRDGGMYNEIYFLRAFLMNNHDYKIILWPAFLVKKKRDWFKANMPKILNQGTGSIWLRKV